MAKKIENPLLPYENKWVALTYDSRKVVASALTIKSLEEKIKKLKNKNVVMTKVLPFDGAFAP